MNMQLASTRVSKSVPNKHLFRVKDHGTAITSYSTRFNGYVILDYHSRTRRGINDSIRIHLMARVRTKDKCIDMQLRDHLAKKFGISLFFSESPNHYHFYLKSHFDFRDDAHTQTKVDAAVQKMNDAVALVYEAKEADRFHGAEKGRPPQMQLVGAFSEPLIEPPQGRRQNKFW